MTKGVKLENQNVRSSQDKCIPQETTIRNVRLAAAYVPYQKLCTILCPIEALKHGTAFLELYSPYEGKDKQMNKAGKDKWGDCCE